MARDDKVDPVSVVHFLCRTSSRECGTCHLTTFGRAGTWEIDFTSQMGYKKQFSRIHHFMHNDTLLSHTINGHETLHLFVMCRVRVVCRCVNLSGRSM